jgi:hypothetical protein
MSVYGIYSGEIIQTGIILRMPESVQGKASALNKWAWNGMGTLLQLASDKILSTTTDVSSPEAFSVASKSSS